MTTTASNPVYAIDAAHASVEFVVRHMMIAKVRGRFTGVTGTIAVPDGSDVPAALEVTIDPATIQTGEPQRDAHLASPDFLDAATYPALTFRSTRIAGSGPAFTVTGDLTVHGVTKPVTLEATFEGRGSDPWGNKRIGYEAHGKISRKDFGLEWNQALETGGVLVGDEVKIELAVEAIAQ